MKTEKLNIKVLGKERLMSKKFMGDCPNCCEKGRVFAYYIKSDIFLPLDSEITLEVARYNRKTKVECLYCGKCWDDLEEYENCLNKVNDRNRQMKQRVKTVKRGR